MVFYFAAETFPASQPDTSATRSGKDQANTVPQPDASDLRPETSIPQPVPDTATKSIGDGPQPNKAVTRPSTTAAPKVVPTERIIPPEEEVSDDDNTPPDLIIDTSADEDNDEDVHRSPINIQPIELENLGI